MNFFCPKCNKEQEIVGLYPAMIRVDIENIQYNAVSVDNRDIDNIEYGTLQMLKCFECHYIIFDKDRDHAFGKKDILSIGEIVRLYQVPSNSN